MTRRPQCRSGTATASGRMVGRRRFNCAITSVSLKNLLCTHRPTARTGNHATGVNYREGRRRFSCIAVGYVKYYPRTSRSHTPHRDLYRAAGLLNPSVDLRTNASALEDFRKLTAAIRTTAPIALLPYPTADFLEISPISSLAALRRGSPPERPWCCRFPGNGWSRPTPASTVLKRG